MRSSPPASTRLWPATSEQADRYSGQHVRPAHADGQRRQGEPGRSDGFGTGQCDIPADGIVGCRIGRRGTGAYSYNHGGSTACTVNSTTGALTITSGTGTCDITASREGDTNYNASAASAPASVTINRATPVVTVTGGVFTYDGNTHAGSATAILNDVNVTGTLSFTYNGVSGQPTNAGTYHLVASFTSADVTNYTNATGTGTITITKADATVTVNGYTGVYDVAPHGATGTATGIGGSALGVWIWARALRTCRRDGELDFTDVTGNYNDAERLRRPSSSTSER